MSVVIARRLLEQCSPVFNKLKPSLLMMMDNEEIQRIFTTETLWELTQHHISIRFLGICRTRSRVLLYDREQIRKTLQKKENKFLLLHFGYDPSAPVEQLLDKLEKKFVRSTSQCFPHEIGVFLGYPAEDIIGFIRNKGKNYKVSGLWNVYGDEVKALKTFAAFTHCREKNLKMLQDGVLFQDIIKGVNRI
jgi:hypothetical protein